LANKNLNKYEHKIRKDTADTDPAQPNALKPKSIRHLVRFLTFNYVEDDARPKQCNIYDVITWYVALLALKKKT